MNHLLSFCITFIFNFVMMALFLKLYKKEPLIKNFNYMNLFGSIAGAFSVEMQFNLIVSICIVGVMVFLGMKIDKYI